MIERPHRYQFKDLTPLSKKVKLVCAIFHIRHAQPSSATSPHRPIDGQDPLKALLRHRSSQARAEPPSSHTEERYLMQGNQGTMNERKRGRVKLGKKTRNFANSIVKSITVNRRPQDSSYNSLTALDQASQNTSKNDDVAAAPSHHSRVSFDFSQDDSSRDLVSRANSAGSTGRRGSARRTNIDQRELTMGLSDLSADFLDLVLKSKGADWLKSLSLRDPRFCIKTFFDDVAKDGANKIEEGVFQPELLSPLIAMFQRSSVFSVWRPTSIDSIEKMMKGHGVGKGLDIKGKSAKKGKLSAYVPFLQIHQDEHKTKIRSLPSGGRIRVFYKKEAPRDSAYKFLMEVMDDMVCQVDTSKEVLAKYQDRVSNEKEGFELVNFREQSRRASFMESEKAEALINLWEMDDPSIKKIDDYSPKCYGLEMPKRLFWEGYVMRASDISRPPGSEFETGRPSTPGFQDMNFGSIKDKFDPDSPRAVVWQYTDPYQPRDQPDPDPMLPQTLLVAYEENGRVLPVVSDFDCFLLGTRGIRYETPLPKEQQGMVLEMIDDTEKILQAASEGKSKAWTASWFENMKSKTTHHTMPQYGFGDPKSYEIMRHAVKRLEEFGAVRHGAECFNYYFPQDLDDEYLVIGGNLEGAKYKYMKLDELQCFLSDCIDKGFTFPLNPKWVLCDKGWNAIWDKLLASKHPNVESSINVWCPPESGIRERIEEVHKKHPQGYEPKAVEIEPNEKPDSAPHLDEAEFALESYHRVQRAKRKFLVVLMWISILQKSQKRVLEKKAKHTDTNEKGLDDSVKAKLEAEDVDDMWYSISEDKNQNSGGLLQKRVTIAETQGICTDGDNSIPDMNVIKKMLQENKNLTASQNDALRRAIGIVEKEASHRNLKRHSSAKMIGEIPSPILQEYGGANPLQVTKAKVTFKSAVHKVIRARRFIDLAKTESSLGECDHLPFEWTQLSKETRKILAKKLSFKSLSSWDFDALEIAELCNGDTLLIVGWAVLASPHAQIAMAKDVGLTVGEEEGYDFVNEFKIKVSVLCTFLRLTESNYLKNPYHNSTHAADVLVTTNSILQLGGIRFAESNLHVLSLLVAAVIHDVKHPGLNNNFHVNSVSEVALQYNDVSVLENKSISWFFSQLLGPTKDHTADIFSGLTPELFTVARCTIVKAVLGTDMSHHFMIMADLDDHEEELAGKDITAWLKPYTVKGCTYNPSLDMLCFILHLADISNPAKPHPMFARWADLVLAEFYAQGDKEAQMGLPISPMCDRATTSKKQSQVGFIKFVVKPAFERLAALIPEVDDVIIPCIEKSLAFWESYEDVDEVVNGARS